MQDPFAAGHEQPQLAADQKSQHQKQAPDRKEEQGQNSGDLRFGLQQPPDHPNRREQADRAAGQACGLLAVSILPNLTHPPTAPAWPPKPGPFLATWESLPEAERKLSLSTLEGSFKLMYKGKEAAN